MSYTLCLKLAVLTAVAFVVTVSGESIPTTTTSFPSAEPTTDPVPAEASANPDEKGDRDCKLLGPFSLLIQLALGAFALLALVYKRWKERPQRPLKVWAFDVSKQVFGSGMLHLANIFMSMISAGQFDITEEYNANPCSYYLLNLGIDVSWPLGSFAVFELLLTFYPFFYRLL